MTINDVDTSRKPKKLGFWMLTALVAGNMIGSGIFLLPSTLAQIGSITLYSWLFTSAGALFLTLVFVRLSVQIPKTGGPYAYAKEGLGHFIGFQTAYNYWLAVWIGNAGIVLALVGYLSVFWPSLAHPKTACIAAIAITWLLTFVNLAGVRSAGLVQLLTTVLKIIPLLIVGILGWFYIHPHYYFETINVTHPHQSNAMAIASGAALTFWSFIGLESATVPAGSVHNPKRNIPRATIFGFCVAALVYILSSTAIMGMIPNHVLQHSDAPFAEAGKIIFGTTGRIIITLGAVISCFGCLNGWILLQGQVAMAAADDKLFPKMFAQRNKHHVPAKGLIITSIFIMKYKFFKRDSFRTIIFHFFLHFR